MTEPKEKTLKDWTILGAVITALATVGAGAIQAFGPGFFRGNADEPPPALSSEPAPAPAPAPESDAQQHAGPPGITGEENTAQGKSGPMEGGADQSPPSGAAPVTPPPAASGPEQATQVLAPMGSRKPTLEASEGVLSPLKTFSNGNVRSQLVLDAVIENTSSEQIRFVVMTSQTSLMLDSRTSMKVKDVSTGGCSGSASNSCRRTMYERYTLVEPGQRQRVMITFWADITPANRAVLPDVAEGNLNLALSVIYNEGVDELVRLDRPSLRIDAAGVK